MPALSASSLIIHLDAEGVRHLSSVVGCALSKVTASTPPTGRAGSGWRTSLKVEEGVVLLEAHRDAKGLRSVLLRQRLVENQAGTGRQNPPTCIERLAEALRGYDCSLAADAVVLAADRRDQAVAAVLEACGDRWDQIVVHPGTAGAAPRIVVAGPDRALTVHGAGAVAVAGRLAMSNPLTALLTDRHVQHLTGCVAGDRLIAHVGAAPPLMIARSALSYPAILALLANRRADILFK